MVEESCVHWLMYIYDRIGHMVVGIEHQKNSKIYRKISSLNKGGSGHSGFTVWSNSCFPELPISPCHDFFPFFQLGKTWPWPTNASTSRCQQAWTTKQTNSWSEFYDRFVSNETWRRPTHITTSSKTRPITRDQKALWEGSSGGIPALSGHVIIWWSVDMHESVSWNNILKKLHHVESWHKRIHGGAIWNVMKDEGLWEPEVITRCW